MTRQDALVGMLCDTQHPCYPDLMVLVDWVEQQRAIARFGYPKDNAFPAQSIQERLMRPEYLAEVIATAEEEEEPPARLLELLRELINAL